MSDEGTIRRLRRECGQHLGAFPDPEKYAVRIEKTTGGGICPKCDDGVRGCFQVTLRKTLNEGHVAIAETIIGSESFIADPFLFLIEARQVIERKRAEETSF